jgi:hypothetical protein
MIWSHSSREPGRAFTLVELLVSMAVLILIMIFISRIMSSVSLSTTLSGRHISADDQARTVFDRIAKDFAGIPQRPDVESLFAKQNGAGVSGGPDPSDKMFFYSEAPAYYNPSTTGLFPTSGSDPKSSVALIGYCINTGSNGSWNTGTTPAPPAWCLQRLSKGLTWDGQFPASGPGGVLFLTFQPGSYTPLAGSTMVGNFTGAVGTAPTYNGSGDTPTDYDVLADQVFRMEFLFQVKDLSVPGQPATVYSNYPVAEYTDTTHPSNSTNQTTIKSASGGDPPATGSATVGDRWYNSYDHRAFICTAATSTGNTWAPNGLSDVTAIVVAIAVLDTNSRKIVTTSQLGNAAEYLTDFTEPAAPSSTPTLVATTWQNTLNQASPTFASLSGIPTAAASQIRVYQRFFYLNNH